MRVGVELGEWAAGAACFGVGALICVFLTPRAYRQAWLAGVPFAVALALEAASFAAEGNWWAAAPAIGATVFGALIVARTYSKARRLP